MKPEILRPFLGIFLVFNVSLMNPARTSWGSTTEESDMSMTIPPAASPASRLPEMREGPGPDRVNDHDGDDGAAARAPAPPPGMGNIVDKTV